MKQLTRSTRRAFLGKLGAAGAASPFLMRGMMAASPNSTLNHVSFGAWGMARADLDGLMPNKYIRLVAAADVDLSRAALLKERYPGVKIYQDWRRLLDKEHKNFDSANVSTPDHMHAPIAMSAMHLGKHVYVQKPLAHDLFEVRRLTQAAAGKRLVTQMGIQIHSAAEYRLAVKLVQDGAVGRIKEVHSWSNKKQGDPSPLPQRTDPVPADLDWDLWLGVCAPRPYIGDGYYHPGLWRRRLDFGCGTFGDMGCHIYDPVYKALALTAPISVRSEGASPNQWNWPTECVVHYVFPGTRFTDQKTVRVTWYDGDRRPPAEVLALLDKDVAPPQGSILVGTDGVLLIPHVAAPRLYPKSRFADFRYPEVPGESHWQLWVEACRGNGRTTADFSYSGPLTEAVLLGGIATRFPQTTLEWNAKKLKFTNVKEANRYVRRRYRKGWSVKKL